MKNYQQPGDAQEFIAPGAVTSGVPIQIGGALLVPAVNAVLNEKFNGVIRGVFSNMPKTTGTAWTQGELIYWDAETTSFTDVAGDNRLAGWAYGPAESAAAVGTVYLDGVARPDETT